MMLLNVSLQWCMYAPDWHHCYLATHITEHWICPLQIELQCIIHCKHQMSYVRGVQLGMKVSHWAWVLTNLNAKSFVLKFLVIKIWVNLFYISLRFFNRMSSLLFVCHNFRNIALVAFIRISQVCFKICLFKWPILLVE